MASAEASPVDRKGKISKRSSNSYTSEEWRRHRPLITQLYFEEGRTLKDVAEYLKREFDFAPTERMYKSRLHTWGLDKKKKEHEMLDLVRQGLQQKGDDKDKVFLVRGRQVTLADALHYFNRKGVKDPTSLLEPQTELSAELSSPEEVDVRTPLSSQDGILDSAQEPSDYELTNSPLEMEDHSKTVVPLSLITYDIAEKELDALQAALNITQIPPMPAFRTLSVESVVVQSNVSPLDQQYLDLIFRHMQTHYRSLFAARDLSISNTTGTWTATSDDALSDRFYYSMYHGYSFLWNGQRDKAFDNFYKAFALIEGLLKDDHVGFMIYIFDLIIRHDGSGYEEPLHMLLGHLAEMAKTVFESEEHPIFLIANFMREAAVSRAWLAESTLRRLLDFFQDSIGYFHPETIALLQTFATSLMNRERFAEAAVRFQQLVDAFETTTSKRCYEVCYALRSTSEAYFHMEQYDKALQALKAALERAESLPRLEEREIYVRCLRGMAEISNKLGRREEANETMRHVVDLCREAFGPEHPFTNRAKMHLKSIQKGDVSTDSAIPPMVYRLGRGGSAAKYIWISRSSPTRLQA
jgi:tetratricopeptide (TPR) repeat protein